MPLLMVNAGGNGLSLHGPGDLDAELAAALGVLAPGAPVVVLVHGYRFSPFDPRRDPHRHILSLTPAGRCRKARSWPRHLGFGRGAADEGLCIAFGWPANGTIWRARDSAARAGAALAGLVGRIRNLRGGPADILCHSLGARVALCAAAAAPPGTVGRVVMMAAAAYRGEARAALATPAGAAAEFVNITSRENDPFDAALEWLVRPPCRGDRALGAGLGSQRANWLDLQLDCGRTLEVLRDLGYRIPAPARRVCHWSAYLRPGLFRLYRELIRDRDLLPLDRLARLLPERPAPRWSRLLARAPRRAPSAPDRLRLLAAGAGIIF